MFALAELNDAMVMDSNKHWRLAHVFVYLLNSYRCLFLTLEAESWEKPELRWSLFSVINGLNISQLQPRGLCVELRKGVQCCLNTKTSMCFVVNQLQTLIFYGWCTLKQETWISQKMGTWCRNKLLNKKQKDLKFLEDVKSSLF